MKYPRSRKMSYGLPYMGSKNKIVHFLTTALPPATHFYDLFGGGGAVTHAAAMSGKWQESHLNDISPLVVHAFVDALNGKFAHEDRWISHEEFMRLRDTDAYASICFSFGNNMRSYAYRSELEPMKKAIHYAIFYGDPSLLEAYMPEARKITGAPSLRERYSAYRQLHAKVFDSSPFLIGCGGLQSYNRLCRLQALESVSQIPLQASAGDYQDVEILPQSTVYCDIPYRNTKTYRSGTFDHDRFYAWADSRDFPVFVSEYDMPPEFLPIATLQRRDSMCPHAAGSRPCRLEKLFVQRRYAARYCCELFT